LTLFRAFSRKARSGLRTRAAELDEKSVDALPVIWLEATLSSSSIHSKITYEKAIHFFSISFL
jgi:hypothetical protein